jgi:hypothetical protein
VRIPLSAHSSPGPQIKLVSPVMEAARIDNCVVVSVPCLTAADLVESVIDLVR